MKEDSLNYFAGFRGGWICEFRTTNELLFIIVINNISGENGYITIQVEGEPAPTFKFYKVS